MYPKCLHSSTKRLVSRKFDIMKQEFAFHFLIRQHRKFFHTIQSVFGMGQNVGVQIGRMAHDFEMILF